MRLAHPLKTAALAGALVLSVLLSGCNSGLTAEQLAVLRVRNDKNIDLAKSHMISFVEAATRTNAQVVADLNGRVSDEQSLLNSQRLALASEVDAGRMTPEVAAYQAELKVAELRDNEARRRAAALQGLTESLARAQEQPRVPVGPESTTVVCHTSTGIPGPLTNITTTCR